MKIRICHAIIKMLKEYGVTHIFGVPGGHTLPLYEAIYDYMPDIKHILFREETNAGFAADGYSKIKAKIGVVDATLGPGALRLVPAIAESYSSSTAVLAIIGDVEIPNMIIRVDRSNAAQATQHIHIFKTITKEQFLVLDHDMLPAVIRQSIKISTSFRPGPVLIDIPVDILWSRKEINYDDTYVYENESNVPSYRMSPDIEMVKTVVNELIAGEKPIIIVGGGIHISGAWKELEKLINMLGIPVVSTISGKGAVKETHPCYIGVIGDLGGWQSANKAVEESDVVLVIGSKLPQYATNNWSLLIDKKIIHIDVDPAELGRNFREHLRIVGDARETIKLMIDILRKKKYKVNRNQWINEVNKLKKDWYDYLLSEIYRGSDGITPQYVISSLNMVINKNSIIVSDASSASGWTAMLITLKNSGRYFLAPRGLAGLGYGVPAGIGAYYGADGVKDVIVVTGDGGLGYTISELETVRRLNIPLKIIVLNDYGLGWIRLIFKAYLNNKVVSSDFYKINYADIAKSCGIGGLHINRPGDVKQAIEYLIKSDEPILLDIVIKTDTPFWPLKQKLNMFGT